MQRERSPFGQVADVDFIAKEVEIIEYDETASVGVAMSAADVPPPAVSSPADRGNSCSDTHLCTSCSGTLLRESESSPHGDVCFMGYHAKVKAAPEANPNDFVPEEFDMTSDYMHDSDLE